eukprot:scaffold206668_cov35-Prasinocladus_malaysianus.AAC.1
MELEFYVSLCALPQEQLAESQKAGSEKASQIKQMEAAVADLQAQKGMRIASFVAASILIKGFTNELETCSSAAGQRIQELEERIASSTSEYEQQLQAAKDACAKAEADLT